MEPNCLWYAVPWSLDICSTQHSPVHRVQPQGASNRDTHLYPSHNNSSVYLTITTYVRRARRITNGTRSGRTTLKDSALSSPTPAPSPSELPSQGQPGSGSTASAPVSDASAPACTNGVWNLLRRVSVAQTNKPPTILSSNAQSADHLMDYTAWQFWTMRQSNGCSTSAPRSNAS